MYKVEIVVGIIEREIIGIKSNDSLYPGKNIGTKFIQIQKLSH